MTLVLLLLAVLALAYANGANDHGKGVATLLGSGVAHWPAAWLWATAATLLGGLAAMLLAGALQQRFRGLGLVEDGLAGNPCYLGAVGLGAGMTVLLATRLSLPISTTHSLLGALLGAGWAAGSAVDLSQLGGVFLVPLVASPLVAAALAATSYPLLAWARQQLGVTEDTCLCAGGPTVNVVPSAAFAPRSTDLKIALGSLVVDPGGDGQGAYSVQASAAVDALHYASAAAVSFARALNDTPKIAALLAGTTLWDGPPSLLAVTLAMALGGLCSASRVAELLGHKITPLNRGQGFVANLVTSVIVIGASQFALPASTTHVACGALFGIGLVTRQGDIRWIARILAAWLVTLPIAAVLGALSLHLILSIAIQGAPPLPLAAS